MPLTLATYSSPRRGSSTRPAGYQPVGMQPKSLLPGGLNSMTATELLVPFEAYSVRPSGLMASALGVLPKRNFSSGLVEMVSTTLFARVSMTEIVSLWALATSTWRPSGVATIPEGCRPTTICLVARPLSRSTTETEPSLAMLRTGSTRTRRRIAGGAGGAAGERQAAGPIADVGVATEDDHIVRRVADGDFARELAGGEVDLGERVSHVERDEHRFSVGTDRHADGDRAVIAARFARQLDGLDGSEFAVFGDVEHADRIGGGRGVHALAIGREDDAFEAFALVRRFADDFARLDIDEQNFAQVEHGEPAAIGREGDIGRPAADDHLPAGRREHLVRGHDDAAVFLLANAGAIVVGGTGGVWLSVGRGGRPMNEKEEERRANDRGA